jgi:hypothetical protein
LNLPVTGDVVVYLIYNPIYYLLYIIVTETPPRPGQERWDFVGNSKETARAGSTAPDVIPRSELGSNVSGRASQEYLGWINVTRLVNSQYLGAPKGVVAAPLVTANATLKREIAQLEARAEALRGKA